jgi:hypothetical protein
MGTNSTVMASVVTPNTHLTHTHTHTLIWSIDQQCVNMIDGYQQYSDGVRRHAQHTFHTQTHTHTHANMVY